MKKYYIDTTAMIVGERAKKALHKAGCKYKIRTDGIMEINCPDDANGCYIVEVSNG